MTEIDQPGSPFNEHVEALAMVETSPDGMILADGDGIILLINAHIETLFGYDRSELVGRTVEVLIPERHRQVHTAHRTRYRVDPKPRSMGSGLDLLARRKDGRELLGYSKEQLLTKGFADLTYPDDAKQSELNCYEKAAGWV